MSRSLPLLLTLWVILLPCAAFASAGPGLLRVPEQHDTIGAALAAATAGDTILVASGTYTENLVWPATPGLKLLSVAGAAETIIDGGRVDQVIGIYSGVDTTTVIRGFTLQHGDAGGA